MTSVIIPDSVIKIEKHAFDSCCSMESVSIGNKVQTIELCAFKDCTRLKAVNIKDLSAWCGINYCRGLGKNRIVTGDETGNPLYYAHHLYLNGEEIKALVIPDDVSSIGDFTFYGGSGFTSLVIPKNVTNIGQRAFYGCRGLTAIEMPNTGISIGPYAFHGAAIKKNNNKYLKQGLICLASLTLLLLLGRLLFLKIRFKP